MGLAAANELLAYVNASAGGMSADVSASEGETRARRVTTDTDRCRPSCFRRDGCCMAGPSVHWSYLGGLRLKSAVREKSGMRSLCLTVAAEAAVDVMLAVLTTVPKMMCCMVVPWPKCSAR